MKQKEKKKIVSLKPNFSDTPFDQQSPQLPDDGVLQRQGQTDRQTDGQRTSMTESAQWVDSVKSRVE